MTFEEYVSEWKTLCRTNVSDGWKIAQDQMLNDHILPYLARQKIDSINPQHISVVINQIKMRGHAATTTKQIFLLLNKMFNDAVSFFEIIDKSPIRKRFHCPKIEHKESLFLKKSQIEHLLRVSEGHWAYMAILIQSLVGLRASEVMALKWKDIDFEKHSIFIRSAYKRRVKRIDEFPKNGRQIRVPLYGKLYAALIADYRKREPSQEEFVCTRADGDGMMLYNSYEKALKNICRKANLPNINSHALRHSCTELWVQSGANQEDLRRLLNHKAYQSTEVYIHRTDERLDRLAKEVHENILAHDSHDKAA